VGPSPRIRLLLRLTRRVAVVLAWIATVCLAAAAGFLAGRVGWLADRASPPDVTAVAASTPRPQPPALIERPALDREPLPAPPPPSRPAPKPASKSAPEPPEPAAKAEPEPPPAPPEPVETTLERARRTIESGDQAAAETLFTEHASFTELTAALVADGASEIDAKLDAVRLLQIAGHDAISRNAARELRLSYAGTRRVADSIRSWGVLKPRIVSADSSIHGSRLTITGTVENPDIVEIRRLVVRIEALDAAGNVIGQAESRVRPRALAAGGTGTFEATFRDLDAAVVLRTRSTITEWESEVLTPPTELG